MKNMLVALLALALLPATSFAGGGTKGQTFGLITVTNNGSDRLAVIIDAPTGFDPKRKTIAQYQQAGGKILNVGETLTIDVLVGQHKFGAAFVSASGVIGKNTTGRQTVPATGLTANVSGVFNIAPTVIIE